MLVAIAALAACGAAPAPIPAVEVAPAPPPQAVRADYTVHEWGLVQFSGATVALATASSPAIAPRAEVPPRPPSVGSPRPSPIQMNVGKPILYLHPGPSFDPATRIDVTVTLPNGALREVWPTPDRAAQPAHTATWTWTDVAIRPASPCASGWAPPADAPACAGLTGPLGCEAADLPRYLDPVADCLAVGGVDTSVLLYNADKVDLPTPLALERGPDGTVLVNLSPWRFGEVWVRTGGAIERVPSLDAMQRFPLAAPGGAPALPLADLPAAFAAAAQAQGLGPTEAAAFAEAWTAVLAAPTWETLAFFPPDAANGVSRLAFDPAPRAVVRVLAFTVAAPPDKR